MRQWRIKNSSEDTYCPGCNPTHRTFERCLGHDSDHCEMTKGKPVHLDRHDRGTHTD